MDINTEQVAFENIVDLGELKSLLENFSVITAFTTGLVDITSNEALLDNDCGMVSKTVERNLEPYFTLKKTCKGRGQGLSFVHEIVKDYREFIGGTSDPEKGSMFSAQFPAREKTISTEGKNGKEIPTGTERILVVDDEITIVNLQIEVLERLGYKVTATTDSREALEKIRSDLDRFDLIITDQSMPYLSGVELAEEILNIKSDLKIILCTGHSSVITEEGALAIGIKKLLKKPVNRSTLANNVRQVLDAD